MITGTYKECDQKGHGLTRFAAGFNGPCFECTEGGVGAVRTAFHFAHGRRVDTEITSPVFGYRLSYRRMIRLYARLIAAWMLGEMPTLAGLTMR